MKFVAGLLILPLCLGSTKALFRVIGETGQAETIWIALLAGFACWLVVYLLLPKPMLIYVFGHEATHAVWTWIFGGRVKRFKVGSRGGRVQITKSNFLIALAPYFFPFYAVAIVGLFVIGDLIWEWSRYAVYFHFLLGAAYSFHVTLTWRVMQMEQTDITEHGYFFSGMVIWLTNILVLIIGIPLLTGHVRLLTAISWCWIETGNIIGRLQKIF
jgi:hypothetical protein